MKVFVLYYRVGGSVVGEKFPEGVVLHLLGQVHQQVVAVRVLDQEELGCRKKVGLLRFQRWKETM